MKYFRTILTSFLVLVSTAMFSAADTLRLKVRPDEQVRFSASLTGTTRVSVVGDRIVKIIQSDSNFEMVNDEGTGDIYLRAISETSQEETGYLVTEGGHTIAFRMVPSKRVDMQTVLITLVGVSTSSASLNSKTGATTPKSAFVVDGGGSTSGAGRIGQLVGMTREAISEKVGLKSAGANKLGMFSTFSKGGLRAKIIVASAPSGARPLPQKFYTSNRTLGVWVDEVVTNGKVWVVVVESIK